MAKAQTLDGYRECYVAFLDILGFKALIERSEADPVVLASLSRLAAVSAQLKPGMKQTDVGMCPMQARSFSDCVAVFTPTRPGTHFAKNGLAQLLFVVRFIHDEMLKLNACVRGGVTVGRMYWHTAWSNPTEEPVVQDRVALPLTFGPGLVAAHELESKRAIVPRVLVDQSVYAIATGTTPLDAYPFGRWGPMSRFFKTDADGELFLDLLHSEVTRSANEAMRIMTAGFTIEWSDPESRINAVRESARALATNSIQENAANDRIRSKHEWLLKYVEGTRPSE